MARAKRTINQAKGGFLRPDYFTDETGKRYSKGDLKDARRQNQMIDESAAMRKQYDFIPEVVADAAVAAKFLPSDPRAQFTAAGLTAAALAGAGLKAYSDQRNEYLPTSPVDVAGRMVNNLLSTGSVGADPLAEARNNVAAAAELVGSEAMVDALAADQINEMRAINEAAMTPADLEGLTGVQEMIDARAQQLMQQPIQKSDGSVAPMGYDTAQRIATEQIAMELRSANVY